MIKLVVVDDHELIREGIKKIIHSSKDMCIVGEATDIKETIDAVERSRPDIIVLDLCLGESDGLESFEQIHARFPEIPVLILSMYPEERFARSALRAGAAGYVTKSMAAEELLHAIRKIRAGSVYVSEKLAELLVCQVRQPEETVLPLHERLTEREQQVLAMLGAGKAAKQIAAELGIGISTVNTYRLRIFRKTGLANTAALIRYAVEHGLIETKSRA